MLFIGDVNESGAAALTGPEAFLQIIDESGDEMAAAFGQPLFEELKGIVGGVDVLSEESVGDAIKNAYDWLTKVQQIVKERDEKQKSAVIWYVVHLGFALLLMLAVSLQPLTYAAAIAIVVTVAVSAIGSLIALVVMLVKCYRRDNLQAQINMKARTMTPLIYDLRSRFGGGHKELTDKLDQLEDVLQKEYKLILA
jgi:hypothetical protein